MVGVFICLLCYFLSDKNGKQLRKDMGNELYGGYVQVIELLLLMENWMSSDHYTLTEVKQAKEFIPLFMHKFKTIIDRKEGHQMKVNRIHTISLCTILCSSTPSHNFLVYKISSYVTFGR